MRARPRVWCRGSSGAGTSLLLVVAAAIAGCGRGDMKDTTVGCGDRDTPHALVYRARPRVPGAALTPATVDAAVEQLCERARASGDEVAVHRTGPDRIEIGVKTLPAGDRLSIAAPAELHFYDWEPNLLPPDQFQPTLSIFTAAETASKQKPKAEKED